MATAPCSTTSARREWIPATTSTTRSTPSTRPTGPSRHAAILVGRFNPAAINAYLTRELAATPRPGPGPASFDVTRIDPATCQPGASWGDGGPGVDRDGRPDLPAGRSRPPDGAPADTPERLGWWRGLAREDVAGVGIPGLERLESGVTQPFVKGGAKALAGEATAFGRVYLGLGVKTVPPQGVLRIVVDAKDAARGAEKIRAWEQTVNASRDRWKESMPSVAKLYDSIRVQTAGARSTIEFTVDRTLAANSQRVIDEVLAAAFGGLGIRVNPPSAEAPAERIDTEPVVFLPAVTLAALPAYDPQAQFAEEVDQIQGPFGVRLGELRLGVEPPAGSPAGSPAAGLEIVVEGFANEIPNVGASEDRVRLFVDSVKAAGGQELLRPEACGRERNNQPASFKSTGSKRLKATKAVRLVPGADPKALQSLTGRVQLRLPTRTEVVTLDHPLPAPPPSGTARSSRSPGSPPAASPTRSRASGRLLLYRALTPRGSRWPRRARSPPTSCSARGCPASGSTRGWWTGSRSCSRPRRRRWSCRSR